MQIGIAKETWPGEVRAAMVPGNAKKLIKQGFKVIIEKNLGESCGFSDSDYENAGAQIAENRAEVLSQADIMLAVRKLADADVSLLKRGSLLISFLDPFNEQSLVQKIAMQGVNSISMEMVPRSTRAQKMDALSSQANLAGYVTVIQAAYHLKKIMPMMMTPSGTISPARVFVIGAGVAGLQAIATAKRLGARVEAFDTRPVVAEQVQSLGAKFVDIDLGDTGQTEQGYANELTQEQIQMQRDGQKAVISQSDAVITTAQLFGRPAPQIIDREMICSMRPGSVIIDMAVESGGNVEGSKLNEVIEVNGVKVVGQGNLPGEVAQNASEMYSNNLTSLLFEFWNEEEKVITLDLQDEILRACLITHQGEVVNETIKKIYSGA